MNFIQKGLSLFRDLHIDIALIFSQFPPLNVALMFKPIQMVCNRSSGNLQTLRNSRRAERVFRKIFPQKRTNIPSLLMDMFFLFNSSLVISITSSESQSKSSPTFVREESAADNNL